MNLRIVTDGLRSAKEYASRMFSFDRLSKNVEAGLYAATVKGILLYKIEVDKQLITYGALAQATSQLPKGGQLAQALQKIAEDDQTHGRPLSTCIVINDNTKMPGDGFFRQCLELGHQFEDTLTGRLLFWRAMVKSLGVASDRGSDEWVSVCGNLDLSIDKSSEIDALQSLWNVDELLAKEKELSAYLEKCKQMPKGARPSTLLHTGGAQLENRPLREVTNPALEEQRKRAFASGTIRVPPKYLQKGDIVLTSDNQELVVESVEVTGNNWSEQVVWTDTAGRKHSEEALGTHRRVKRATEGLPPKNPVLDENHTFIASVELAGGLWGPTDRITPYDNTVRKFPSVLGVKYRYIRNARTTFNLSDPSSSMSEQSGKVLAIQAPPGVHPLDKRPLTEAEKIGGILYVREFGNLPSEGEVRSWKVDPPVEAKPRTKRPTLEDLAYHAEIQKLKQETKKPARKRPAKRSTKK